MDNVENFENNDNYGKTIFGQNSVTTITNRASVGPTTNAKAVA